MLRISEFEQRTSLLALIVWPNTNSPQGIQNSCTGVHIAIADRQNPRLINNYLSLTNLLEAEVNHQA